LFYSSGHGVSKDSVQAHKWLNLAAAGGVAAAANMRDENARFMSPAQIAEAQKLAREWRKKEE
jgi:TPR repeat protein